MMSLSTVLRSMVVMGVASLAMFGGSSLQAQATTYDPVFLCGVVGVPGSLQSTQGDAYIFPAAARPSFASVQVTPPWQSLDYSLGASVDGNDNFINLTGARRTATTEPSFLSGTMEIRNGTTVVGTQELYVVIFSTAVHRDAFIYYVQQRELAETETEYGYFTTLGAYEFWMGQEDEGLALYSYYTGMASYLRDTASDPKQGMYDYYYNIGLGAYYYFLGIGDSESAWLAFVYHVQLANEALQGEEGPPAT